MTIDSVKNMKEALCEKLKVSFGSTVEEASDAQMMRASALVLRDVMAERSVDSMRENRAEHRRQVHYLSMEFLMGRSLMKNAFNLGVGEILTEALNELGFRAADVFECEPDAGLGNGGLGRLASCYMDAATGLDIPMTGFSIRYEFGIFRQKMFDLSEGILEMRDIQYVPGIDRQSYGHPGIAIHAQANRHLGPVGPMISRITRP